MITGSIGELRRERERNPSHNEAPVWVGAGWPGKVYQVTPGPFVRRAQSRGNAWWAISMTTYAYESWTLYFYILFSNVHIWGKNGAHDS